MGVCYNAQTNLNISNKYQVNSFICTLLRTFYGNKACCATERVENVVIIKKTLKNIEIKVLIDTI